MEFSHYKFHAETLPKLKEFMSKVRELEAAEGTNSNETMLSEFIPVDQTLQQLLDEMSPLPENDDNSRLAELDLQNFLETPGFSESNILALQLKSQDIKAGRIFEEIAKRKYSNSKIIQFGTLLVNSDVDHTDYLREFCKYFLIELLKSEYSQPVRDLLRNMFEDYPDITESAIVGGILSISDADNNEGFLEHCRQMKVYQKEAVLSAIICIIPALDTSSEPIIPFLGALVKPSMEHEVLDRFMVLIDNSSVNLGTSKNFAKLLLLLLETIHLFKDRLHRICGIIDNYSGIWKGKLQRKADQIRNVEDDDDMV